MQITIPPKIRVGIYIATALITPLIGYMRIKGIIGDQEVQLWGAYVTVVATIAGLNITKPQP